MYYIIIYNESSCYNREIKSKNIKIKVLKNKKRKQNIICYNYDRFEYKSFNYSDRKKINAIIITKKLNNYEKNNRKIIETITKSELSVIYI
jgi:hypothetical protein